MMGLHSNFAGLALILWAGLLICAGTACVLSSQVGRMIDFLRKRERTPVACQVDDGRRTVRHLARNPRA